MIRSTLASFGGVARQYGLSLQLKHWRTTTTSATIKVLQSIRKQRSSNKAIASSSNANTQGTTIYALGEGWTGALGNGTLDLTSPDYGETFTKMNFFSDVEAIAAGWGHTAITTRNEATGKRNLFVCGRPHEFRTLLRLKRLPEFVRKFACGLSWQHTFNSFTMDESLNPYLVQTDKTPTYNSGDNTTYFQRFLAALNRVGREQEIIAPLESSTSKSERHDQFHPAAELSILLSPTEIPIPSLATDETYGIQNPSTSEEVHKKSKIVAASAGLTAVICPAGRLYTFGLNPYGQCGVGFESNNVWTCTPVVGLTTSFMDENDLDLVVGLSGSVTGTSRRSKFTQQQYPIVSVALGLQHAIALDSMGNVYTFGKGERGQLGNGRDLTVPYAVHVPIRLNPISSEEEEDINFNAANTAGNDDNSERLERARARFLKRSNGNSSDLANSASAPLKASQIAAGFNHCAVVTTTNHVFIWGKNVIFNKKTNTYEDAFSPTVVSGLPPDKKVIDVSCGSRHTSMLLEDGSIWAVGIAYDTGAPLLDTAVQIMEASNSGTTVQHFSSSFDKTIVVRGSSDSVVSHQHVRCINLWSTEELRAHVDSSSQEEPEWLDQLQGDRNRITMIDSGWLHTVVVLSEDKDQTKA
eukprot:CAMPEP_0172427228 /NCGR_PEP_ID=MMETSP1064-20121228/41131_1 /TAXON_ID=202472 /ORGANISM="Aulacoseira subarctica , Strain CCAP 1002/5" /LENGTH=638 /DNA_ID=CAMNT_0013171329 /DNA_START=204 /DNA_END=2120 /DNA_ORIENTATION=+